VAPAANEPGRGDWCDTGTYDWLLKAGRAIFAWEWLRRSPAYRAAYAADAEPTAFGLVQLVDPSRDARTVRPIWTTEVYRSVLRAEILTGSVDRIDISRLGSLATIVPSATGGAHLLISDGLHAIRVDVTGGSSLNAPVALRFAVDGVLTARPILTALQQLIGVLDTGRFAASLWPREAKAARWISWLRVFDALTMGASHRDIAGVLYGEDAAGSRWRIVAPSVRLKVQRLTVAARAACAEGSFPWLCDPGAGDALRHPSC
jgi:hypothetical protein